MKLNFLVFASELYYSNYKVLEQSIFKHHPDAEVMFYDLGPSSPGYIQGLAKIRLEKALEMLEQGYENVVLLGADCELFAPLKEVEDLLYGNDYTGDTSDIILSPHITKWFPEDGLHPSNSDIYLTGHCNADFVVFRNCENTKQILRDVIKLPMIDDKHNGVFYEQTWLSGLPFMYENVVVLKNLGYNVAYFNIHQRDFKFQNGEYHCGQSPLALMQYSGFDKSHPEKMSKHQNRWKAEGDILKIFEEYKVKLETL